MAKLDILLNKKVSIERCITQIKHYYATPTKTILPAITYIRTPSASTCNAAASSVLI